MAAAPDLSLNSGSYPKGLRRVISAFAKRAGGRQLAAGLGDIGALALEVIGNRPAQIRVGDEMRRPRGLRQVATRQLVFALRAGLDIGEPALDREIDRLVIADLEVQEGVMFDGAPV